MTAPVNQEAEVEDTRKSSSVIDESELVHKKPARGFDGYNPTAIDFIRRCGSEKEAQEIIEYMERAGEIARGEAQKMKSQLHSKGLRSFGAKKEFGYYLKSIE